MTIKAHLLAVFALIMIFESVDAKEGDSKTLRFSTKDPQPILIIMPSHAEQTQMFFSNQGKNAKFSDDDKVVEVDFKRLKDFVQNAKNHLCDAVKPGSITLWLKAEVSGDLKIVSASTESGFQMELTCK